MGAGAKSAFACSCIAPGTPEQELQKSDAVFSGTVHTIDKTTNGYHILFDVSEIWKGISAASVEVATAQDSAACGFAFEKDKAYLVYAYESEDGLSTNICTRTALLSEATNDVIALGESSTPLEATSTPFSTSTIIVGILVVLILGFILFKAFSPKKAI